MKLTLMLIAILLLPSSLALETANVTKVIDGDTITLDNGEKVRLIGIDTPERGQCYYKEAKTALKNLVLNKQISLEKDITNRDKYNRLLRYIYYNNTLINGILVKEGYARAYYYKPDIKLYKGFKQSEISAKINALGLWHYCIKELDLWTIIEIKFLRLIN